MEEKDIDSIAKAVTAAVGKLNEDTKEKEKDNNGAPETFNCPECGSKVNANSLHCSNCGCPLEWGE